MERGNRGLGVKGVRSKRIRMEREIWSEVERELLIQNPP